MFQSGLVAHGATFTFDNGVTMQATRVHQDGFTCDGSFQQRNKDCSKYWMGCGLPGRENYRPSDGDTIMNNNGWGVSWRPLPLPGSDTPNNNNDNGYDHLFKDLTNGMNQAQRNAFLDNGYNGLPGFTCNTEPLPLGLVDICNPP